MFDAEKLLGKIVGEVIGKGHGSYGKGKKSAFGGLASGAGLMTIIGLGVGAYEILKEQGVRRQEGGQAAPPPLPPVGGAAGVGGPPPLPVSRPAAAQPPPPPPAMPSEQAAGLGPQGADLAMRLIRVMIAAAHADGRMDEQEERAILERLRGAELSGEEKLFLVEELHRPLSIEALAEGVADPAVAKTMYMLAVAAITIDSEAERAWLDQLGQRLGLSGDLQAFIEDQR